MKCFKSRLIIWKVCSIFFCRKMSTSPGSPKNYHKPHLRHSPESGNTSLPYHGLHHYPWNLQRQSHGGPSSYPTHAPYYYNSNPYYRTWFNNYREQWQQQWQRIKGKNYYNDKISSIFGKFPRRKFDQPKNLEMCLC